MDTILNILYFITAFIIGWIIGSFIRIVKRGKPQMPLLTPEEREMYKALQKHVEELNKKVKMYEELIDDIQTGTNKKETR